MRSVLVLGLAAAISTMFAQPAISQVQPSQEALPCINMGSEINPDQVIGVCSTALNSALVSEKVKGKVLHRRGNAYQQKGQHDLAIKDLDDALRDNPDNIEARVDRGMSFVAIGSFDEAIKDFDVIIKNHPDHARAHLGRGKANAGKGMDAEAVRDFGTAIKLQPNEATAYYLRAFAFNRLGYEKEAIADFEQAAKLGGDPITRDLQTYLKDKGKYRMRIDGKYGPGSRAAMKACVKDPDC